MAWWKLPVAHGEEIAHVITREGTPPTEARGEVNRVADFVRWHAEEAPALRTDDTEVDLAGYVSIERLDRALNLADRLEAGLVGTNQRVPSNAAAPYGGIRHSGRPGERSSERLEEYLSVRSYNTERRSTH